MRLEIITNIPHELDFESIYITKQSWKEHQKDKGIVAVAIERWFEDVTRVGIVKSRNFTLESERVVRDELSKEGLHSSTARWLGYLPNLSETFSAELLGYYNYILENPETITPKGVKMMKSSKSSST
jgi:hypothetical protein